MLMLLGVLLVFLGSVHSKATTYPCGIAPNIEKYTALLSSGGGTGNLKIIGGTESINGDWPFVVNVYAGEHGATGSIIHPKWVLTASHCDVDEHSSVYYGNVEGLSGTRVNVTRTISLIPGCHIGEDGDCQCCNENDIRLVELAEPIPFADGVAGAICLPSDSKSPDTSPGVRLAHAGYGSDETPISSGLLREVVLPVREPSVCRLNSTRMFCAGDRKHVSFHGDSGGPVMTIKDGKWFQQGVVSKGSYDNDVDASQDKPSACRYMKVSIFCDWIHKNTNGDVSCI